MKKEFGKVLNPLEIFRRKCKLKISKEKALEKNVQEIILDALPQFRKLANEQGIVRFSHAKRLPLGKGDKFIKHKDVVVSSPKGKMYAIILQSDQSLQIADLEVDKGIERVLFFENNLVTDSLKIKKKGSLREYMQPYTLNHKEQIAFIREVLEAKVDVGAMKELSKKSLIFN